MERLTAWRRARAAAAVEGLVDEVLADPRRATRSPMTPTRFLAFVVAWSVHLVTLLLVVAGVWMIVVVRGVGGIFAGVLLLMLAWTVLPFRRESRRQRYTRVIATPALRGLVERCADLMGAPRPVTFELTGEFNAWVGRDRRTGLTLTLGLPLWQSLSPAGRVALIGHELGHLVNGDLRRTGVVRLALVSLREWYLLCRYDLDDPRRAVAATRSHDGYFYFIEVATSFLLRIIGVIPWLLGQALALTTQRDAQRAEYAADLEALRLSGPEGAREMAIAIVAVSSLEFRAIAAVNSGNPDPLSALTGAIAEISDLDVASLVARAAKTRNVYDSHPPSDLRVRLVREVSGIDLVDDPPRDGADVEAELAQFRDWGNQQLRDLVWGV